VQHFNMIAVTINGEARRFGHALTVSELIEQLQLTGKRVALERNGELVPRGRFAEERVVNGDRLEIVVAVGGG
jgi:sulfur carrier protein